jgi:hypothetical protein
VLLVNDDVDLEDFAQRQKGGEGGKQKQKRKKKISSVHASCKQLNFLPFELVSSTEVLLLNI